MQETCLAAPIVPSIWLYPSQTPRDKSEKAGGWSHYLHDYADSRTYSA